MSKDFDTNDAIHITDSLDQGAAQVTQQLVRIANALEEHNRLFTGVIETAAVAMKQYAKGTE